MGDVAAILGVSSGDMDVEGPPPPAPSAPPRALKLQGLPKEVADLMAAPMRRGASAGDVELPMAVPAANFSRISSSVSASVEKRDAVVKVGNKWISASKPARKWVWAPFSSSARTDGLLLHHWVRNVEYPDYPYARFDIHLDPVTYSSDEEYRTYLHDSDWTKGETDQLLQLAKRFELRWPVIYDRWIEHFHYGCTSDIDTPRHRKIEDLQHRFYNVAAILMQLRIKHEAATEAQSLASQTSAAAAAAATAEAGSSLDDSKRNTDALLIETAAARALASTELPHQPVLHNIGTGTTNKVAFDLNYERERRVHLEALWNLSKEEETEEAELRKELKQVEAQLRKLKKAGAHIAAGGGTSAASSRNASRAGTPVQVNMADVPAALNQAFAASIPTAVAGTPYLQSGRLLPPALGGGSGINKALRLRMDEVLDELGIREQPLATKRVCDLYDTVRKDILTLLILQRTAFQKEGLLASRRLQLAKLSGNAQVIDEETLLGVQSASTSMTTTQAASARASHGSKIARSGSKLGNHPPSVGRAKVASVRKEGMALGAEARKDTLTAMTPMAHPVTMAAHIPTAMSTMSSGIKPAPLPRKVSAPSVKRKRKDGQKSPTKTDAFVRPVTTAPVPALTPGLGSTMISTDSAAPAGVSLGATTAVGSDGKSKKRPKKSTA